MKLLFGAETQILLTSAPGEGLSIRMLLPSGNVLIKEEHHESL